MEVEIEVEVGTAVYLLVCTYFVLFFSPASISPSSVVEVLKTLSEEVEEAVMFKVTVMMGDGVAFAADNNMDPICIRKVKKSDPTYPANNIHSFIHTYIHK